MSNISENDTNVSPNTLEPTEFSKSYQKMAVLLLMIIYTCSLLDRYIMNILAESIKVDLGLADWQIGLMTGLAFALCYSVLGIPIARYADRGDRPMIISAAISVWSLATILTGFVQNFTQMLLARTLVGMGEAGCTPPAHSLISEYVPKENRAFAISIYSIAAPLGLLLGMVIGGVVADHFGWRWAFILVGAPGLLIALISYIFLREPRRRSLVNNRNDLPTSKLSIFQALKELWKINTFKWTFIASSFAGTGLAGVMAFQASFFLRTHSDALNDFALSMGMGPMGILGITLGLATGVTSAIGTVFGGYLADKWRQKGDGSGLLRLPAISALLAGLFTAAIYVSTSLTAALACLSISGLFLVSWMGPIYAAAHSVAPPSLRATSSAVLLLAVSLIGLSVGPFVVGALSGLFDSSLGLGSAIGLKWALLTTCLFFLLATPMYWLASRHFKNDVLE